MLAVDFLQLMPGFETGASTLHNILIGVTLVLSFCGLLLLVSQGLREKSTHNILPTLVRLAVIVIMVGSLGAWGNLLVDGVNDVVAQMGLNGIGGGIFAAYRNAVARKFGSDGAAQQGGQQQQAPQRSLYSNGGLTPSASGIQLNHYGYEQPGSPNYDKASADGRGAFTFDTEQGSLVPLQSAALSSDVVQAYNLQPGQAFTVSAGGQTYNLIYADKTADYIQGSVDIYDPHQQLGSNQLVGLTSMQDGPVEQGGDGGPLGGWISKLGDSLTVGLLYPLVHLLSLIALGIMYLMQAVQQILYTVEIAVSPIFIGMMMIPRLVGIATRFFCSLVSICLWALGWAICDLLTRALIGFAINPTNNLALSAFSGASMMLGYWVLLAVWVIGSSFVAPLIISGLIVGGGAGVLAPVFGATVGAMAGMAAGGGRQAASAAVGVAAAPISVASSSAMNAFQSFARRPKSNTIGK